MTIALTTRFNSNTAVRDRVGDVIQVVYDIDVTGSYPDGGETISFATEFREVHSVSEGGVGPWVGGNPWNDLIYIPRFVRSALNAGFLRFYVGAAAGAQFAQAAVAAYGSDFRVTLLVIGRPATDSV